MFVVVLVIWFVYFLIRPRRESKRQRKPKRKEGEESDPFDFDDDEDEHDRPTGNKTRARYFSRFSGCFIITIDLMELISFL